MNRSIPAGRTAVMAARQVDPPNALEYFPTPPWATRALFAALREFDPAISTAIIAEPCAGEGHMAEVLREISPHVLPSDIFDHGKGYPVADVLDEAAAQASDFLITNPPFTIAEEIIRAGLARARRGVAIFIRLQFLEAQGRYERLFGPVPPRAVLLFSERCALKRGEWDPNGSTATAYVWIIWTKGHAGPTEFRWLPPVQKTTHTHPDDVRRFAAQAEAPLFDGEV